MPEEASPAVPLSVEDLVSETSVLESRGAASDLDLFEPSGSVASYSMAAIGKGHASDEALRSGVETTLPSQLGTSVQQRGENDSADYTMATSCAQLAS